MKVELEIRGILKHSFSVTSKVDKIISFMNWDKEKLVGLINKNGTSNNEARSKIINEFWTNGK